MMNVHLTAFEAKWDKDYPPISQSWPRNWARISPFFDYPDVFTSLK